MESCNDVANHFQPGLIFTAKGKSSVELCRAEQSSATGSHFHLSLIFAAKGKSLPSQ